jgi:hypothetical protein
MTTEAADPKCPISGQIAKNGETCAYDPTKMSFWTTSKPVAVKQEIKQEPIITASTTVAAVDPKCPISGKAAKNGETCDYDPTKMSFWTKSRQPVEVKQEIKQEIRAESDGCPMKGREGGPPAGGSVSSFVAAADMKYKNKDQYNVRLNDKIYLYMCIYIHIYLYLYMYIHIYTNVYEYVYVYICMYMYLYVYMYICICVHIQICTCIYTYIYVYI